MEPHDSQHPESWVWLTSVPESELSSLGLLLGSQSILFIPSTQAPEQFFNDESLSSLLHHEGQIAFYIQYKDLNSARLQMSLWTQENQLKDIPEDEVIQPIPELSVSPLSILAIPALFYILLPLLGDYPLLKESGLNNAQKVLLEGEWWRLWTALTLHADHKHLLSNLISGYFVLNLLRTRFATSKQWLSLLIMSGVANYFVVFTHGADAMMNHRSLGFSTFVFAALGMLAAAETKNLYLQKSLQFKKLTPFTSSFFIVVMMGLGEGSDILAHFYGFFFGLIPGIFLRLRQDSFNEPTRPLKPLDLTLWTMGLGLILCSWALAL